MDYRESEMMHYALEIKRHCQQTHNSNYDPTRFVNPCEGCIFFAQGCKIAGVFMPNGWRI